MSSLNTASNDVILERRIDALWLTLNRPEAHNALTSSMVDALHAAMDRVDVEKDVRAFVLTGAGGKFCAGADLKAVANAPAEDAAQSFREFLDKVGTAYNRLERLRVPTIASVGGLALAGGMELMLCCDFIIMDENAKIGDGHANFAQLPAAGNSVRLPRRIGAARTKQMMFTGELVLSEKALSWGLVDQVVSAQNMELAVEALISKMADKSPLVLECMKRLVQDAQDQPLDVALRAEVDLCVEHMLSHDRNEGLAAFTEKRKPVYLGR